MYFILQFILQVTINFYLPIPGGGITLPLLLLRVYLIAFFSCKLEHGQLAGLGQARLYFIQQNILDCSKYLRFPINI